MASELQPAAAPAASQAPILTGSGGQPPASPLAASKLSSSTGGIAWSKVTDVVRKCNGLFSSLDKFKIREGFVYFDEKTFTLPSRNSATTLRFAVWFTNLLNTGATFTETQRGLLVGEEFLKSVSDALETFAPPSPEVCPKEATDTLMLLIDAQNTVKTVAQSGLKKLCKNYEARNKEADKQNAASLREIGTRIFALVDKIELKLEETLKRHFPNIESQVTLKKYSFKADIVLNRWAQNIDYAGQVVFNHSTGTTIPMGAVTSAVLDAPHNFKLGRGALFNAVKRIDLAMKAEPFRPKWLDRDLVPLRLITDGQGHVVKQAGVTGSAEQTDDLRHLCASFDPDTHQIVLTSGAADSPKRFAQLGFALTSLLYDLKIALTGTDLKPSARLAFLQLETCGIIRKDALIRGLNANLPAIRGALRSEYLPEQELSLHHVNIGFTSVTKGDWTLSEINVDSLAKLVSQAFADVDHLLEHGHFEANRAVIETIRKEMNPLLEATKAMVTEIEKLKESSAKGQTVDMANLKKLQKDLELQLSTSIFKAIDMANSELRKAFMPNRNADLNRALTIFGLLNSLFSSEFKPVKGVPAPWSKIEHYLMLYRLLGFHTVIMDEGLDSSGCVHARLHALIQMEKYFYSQLVLASPIQDRETKERICRWEAQMRVVNHIRKFEGYRHILMRLEEPLLAEYEKKGEVISDLSKWDEKSAKAGADIRKALFDKIDAEYPIEDDTKGPIGQELKDTRRDMDLYAAFLYGAEAKRQIWSFGVRGLLSDHDAYYFTERWCANPLPLDRLPLSAKIAGGPEMRLLHFYEGGSFSNPSEASSDAGMKTLLGMSQLRGK